MLAMLSVITTLDSDSTASANFVTAAMLKEQNTANHSRRKVFLAFTLIWIKARFLLLWTVNISALPLQMRLYAEDLYGEQSHYCTLEDVRSSRD